MHLVIPTVEDEDMVSYASQGHFSPLHPLRTGTANFYVCINVSYLPDCVCVLFTAKCYIVLCPSFVEFFSYF